MTVVGAAAAITAGEFVQASGSSINDRTHGLQFKATFLNAAPLTTLEWLKRYPGSGMVKGIGPVYARKLVHAFGEAVFDLVEGTPERLREVAGIGLKRAERIRQGWAEEKVVRETMLSLHGHGVGTLRAVRFFKTYPPLVPPELTALPSPFDAQLVNGPFGDPALFVDLVHGRRAFLVHAGDLTALAPRKLLRVTDIFISHTHMDHWSGFDRFLRLALGRDRTVRLFGPPGMAEWVDHKLRAYTWNLLESYTNELAFEVTEIGEQGASKRTAFRLCAGFVREPLAPAAGGPVVVEDAHLRVTATTLDHGIPCLAYAIEERIHVNVWKTRLAELGLGAGPWLTELKSLVVTGAHDDSTVQARWREEGRLRTESFALGFLRERLLRIVPGRKLAYVTDAAWTPSNIDRIVELASDAEILFIEAPFLDRDWERAAARRHLTARQAGVLARRTGVKRVVPFHFSPRHVHEEWALRGEVEAAFAGGQGIHARAAERET